jgi:hypothetical protein
MNNPWKKPWETDSCEAVQAYFTLYPVPVAAALWCNIPAKEVDEHLKIATVGPPGIFRHPYIPCLEPRCRAIHDAIINGALDASRENGQVTKDHIAPARRYVSRESLKQWIAKTFPADRPAFLFDEVERQAHPAINADSFRALQADRDALKAALEREKQRTKELTNERDAMRGERDSLKAMVENGAPPAERATTTYLNIIGGLLGLMLGKSPAGKPGSAYENQAAIISAMLAHYEGRQGIAARTLEEKFAAAKRSISQ